MMRHRHLDTDLWSRAAIDSAIEYGDLADWRELFEAVRHDRALAQEVLIVTRAHHVDGASSLAQHLVSALWPEVSVVESR